MIKLENINTVFNPGTPDENLLFDNFYFEMKPDEFVSVIGSNGSGKTTLLNLICGSRKPDSGKITFGGDDITHMNEHRRAAKIGRVMQDPKAGTCPNLTILENMALSDNKHKAYGLGTAVNRQRRDYYCTLLEQCSMGLENRLSVLSGSLSGGQRQALALIIAVMSDVELLILDEHTAALDPKSSETIMKLTHQLISSKEITTIMVTHNLRYALEYGNRMIMMDEGKIIMDLSGNEKTIGKMDTILDTFNQISIEKGN